ncbi:MAG: hypothetical protein ABI480_15960 [Chitinophagaceae bacterium]
MPKVNFEIEYISLYGGGVEIIFTTIDFLDTGHSFDYSYILKDAENRHIAGRGASIYKKTIDTDELQFLITHAMHNINDFLINRKRHFKVLKASLHKS